MLCNSGKAPYVTCGRSADVPAIDTPVIGSVIIQGIRMVVAVNLKRLVASVLAVRMIGIGYGVIIGSEVHIV